MSLAGFTHIGDYTLPTLAGTHTNFPVVLRYADFGAGVLSQLKADGGDLRFSTSADVQIAAHVKTFNPATNDILVHVCVPSASTGEVIKIWGNNAGASALPATDPYGQYAAYVGWLFFSHDGASDDTGDLNFVGSGTPDASPFSGQATDFDGVVDGYTASYSGGGQASGANWTFSALVKPDAIPATVPSDIINSYRDTITFRRFSLSLGVDGRLLVADQHSNAFNFSGSTILQTDGTWYQVGAVKRGRSGLRDLYLDGVQDVAPVGGDMGTQYSTHNRVSIGKRQGSNFFNGAIAHAGARFGSAESAEWFSDHTSNLTAAGAWGTMTSTGGGVPNITYNEQSVPNVTATAVQGFCRDDSHFYLINSTFGTSSEELKKVTIQGITTATNSNLYAGIPAGNWKTNDGCIYEGLIYFVVSDRDSSAVRLVSYNKSDLSFNSDISSLTGYEKFSAGVCIGSSGNLFAVAFYTSTNANAQRVAEFELDGTFVQYHSLSQEILEMQGITFDGTDYWISSSASNLVYQLDGSFNVLNTYQNNAAMTEIEGLDYYEGKYYTHDIEQVPYIFNTDTYTPTSDTFPAGWQRIVELTGTTPSGAIAGNVMLITESNLPAEIWTIAQNGGEDLRACLSSDGTSQIPLRVLEFDTVNQTAKILVKTDYDIGSESVFIAYGTTGHTEQSPPNGSFGRNTVVSDRSLSMWDGTYDITSDGEDTSRQFVTAGANLSPAGLRSSSFRGGASSDYLEKVITSQSNYTITAWYRPDAVANDGNDLVLLQNPTASATSQSSLLDDASPADLGLFNTTDSWLRSGYTRTLSAWQRVVVVGNGSAGTRTIWVNGTQRATGALGSEDTSRTLIRIGQRLNSNASDWRMDGQLSGIEVINKAVESDFAATDYVNQNTTSTFWTTGTPQDIGSVPDITVDVLDKSYSSSLLNNILALTLSNKDLNFSLNSLIVGNSASVTLLDTHYQSGYSLADLQQVSDTTLSDISFQKELVDVDLINDSLVNDTHHSSLLSLMENVNDISLLNTNIDSFNSTTNIVNVSDSTVSGYNTLNSDLSLLTNVELNNKDYSVGIVSASSSVDGSLKDISLHKEYKEVFLTSVVRSDYRDIQYQFDNSNVEITNVIHVDNKDISFDSTRSKSLILNNSFSTNSDFNVDYSEAIGEIVSDVSNYDISFSKISSLVASGIQVETKDVNLSITQSELFSSITTSTKETSYSNHKGIFFYNLVEGIGLGNINISPLTNTNIFINTMSADAQINFK